MKLSIIIPAFNEEKLIAACLASVFSAVQRVSLDCAEYEVIVCDNNSTDRTAEIAHVCGATVVFEPINQISRARNAGAAAATGDWFLFIDADSQLHPNTLENLLDVMATGHVAGIGCRVALDYVPWYFRPSIGFWHFCSFTFTWAAGSFVFCRADAFRDVGGFPLDLFAAEEIEFSRKMKRWAKARGMRLVILRKHPHISSGRKLRTHGVRELLRLIARVACKGKKALRSKEGLGVFYDGKR